MTFQFVQIILGFTASLDEYSTTIHRLSQYNQCFMDISGSTNYL